MPGDEPRDETTDPIRGDVHWAEGMALQPHHFQVLQRRLVDRIVDERNRLAAYPWGVLSGQLVAAELAQSTVHFQALRAIMPATGVVVDVPGNTDQLRRKIDDRAFVKHPKGVTVYVALPLPQSGVALVADERVVPREMHDRCTYVAINGSIDDENTASHVQDVTFRRLNARLVDDTVVDDDYRRRFDVLAVARLVREPGKTAELDPEFLPPAALLARTHPVRGMVDTLAAEVESARSELADYLAGRPFRPATVAATEVEPLVRLQVLARHAVGLRHALTPPQVAPFALHGELARLFAELQALSPDRPWRSAGYNHDAPYDCFRSICSAIAPLLRRIAVTVDVIPFEFAEGHFRAVVPEPVWQRQSFHLGIRVDRPVQSADLARTVTDPSVFKVMPASDWNQQWDGLKVDADHSPPPELRSREPQAHFFRLHPGTGMSKVQWEKAQREKALGIRWPQCEGAGWKLGLYMSKTAEAPT